MTRDPLIDPQPNDVVQSGQIQLHVHFRKPEAVFFGRWREVERGNPAKSESLDMIQCGVDRWREECAAKHAEVIQRAEELGLSEERR